MTRMLIGAAVLVVAAVACKDESSSSTSSSSEGVSAAEIRFVEREVARLEKGIAARSEAEMTTGCAMVATDVERLPSGLGKKIAKLCYVDVPTILLELGIADVKKQLPTAPPELADMPCMQLFAPDAVKTADLHPMGDANLAKLVAEFTALCPKEVAKVRAQPKVP